ncbi:Phosphatidylinositol 4-phosphate 5-kinase 5 [Diplonema papillatum]|nr:Phosphatidylinositol 4-phosphate 5-kinase 5 [Diplonema papillatum]
MEPSEFYEGTRNKKGQRHGEGTARWVNGDVYKGAWKNGFMHGQGRFVFTSGDVYQGEVYDGKRCGKGTYWFAEDGVYKGSFKDDAEDGHGQRTWQNGHQYTGGWKRGYLDGFGVASTSVGDRYVGWFDLSLREGRGALTFPDGSRYVGHWSGGVRSGLGTLLLPSGCGYDGCWKNDAPHGTGTWFAAAAGEAHTGPWDRGALAACGPARTVEPVLPCMNQKKRHSPSRPPAAAAQPPQAAAAAAAAVAPPVECQQDGVSAALRSALYDASAPRLVDPRPPAAGGGRAEPGPGEPWWLAQLPEEARLSLGDPIAWVVRGDAAAVSFARSHAHLLGGGGGAADEEEQEEKEEAPPEYSYRHLFDNGLGGGAEAAEGFLEGDPYPTEAFAPALWARACRAAEVRMKTAAPFSLGVSSSVYSLVSLGFGEVYVGAKGALALLEFAKACPNVTHIGLAWQGMSAASFSALVAVLAMHPRLKSVDLSGNFVPHDVGKLLARSAAARGNLECIVLRGTQLSDAVTRQVEERLAVNRRVNTHRPQLRPITSWDPETLMYSAAKLNTSPVCA